jgi:hypothetical protein
MSFLATHLVGFGAGGPTNPVTMFSATLDSNAAGSGNSSSRQTVTNSSAVSGTQVRVRFQGPSSGTLNVDNASVGIRSGATANTVATPVELKFSGVSGFSLSATAEITSDWADLVIGSSDELIVVNDHGGTSTERYVLATGPNYFKLATDSYATASVSGFTSQGIISCLNLVEVRFG